MPDTVEQLYPLLAGLSTPAEALYVSEGVSEQVCKPWP